MKRKMLFALGVVLVLTGCVQGRAPSVSGPYVGGSVGRSIGG